MKTLHTQNRIAIGIFCLLSFTVSLLPSPTFAGNTFSKAKDGFVFDPAVLEAKRAGATEKIMQEFKEKGDVVLYQEAALYFIDTQIQDQSTLLEAYKTERTLTAVHEALKATYPDQITDKLVWSWNNVGNIWARMAILSCSLSEYMVIWGTNIPQQAFSGYYPSMDVYDIMVTGKMFSNGAGSPVTNPLIYTPGARISYLERGDTRFYSLDRFSYMIDYGRGQIAKTFWQGLIAPYLFSNHDWDSLKRQFLFCAKQIL